MNRNQTTADQPRHRGFLLRSLVVLPVFLSLLAGCAKNPAPGGEKVEWLTDFSAAKREAAEKQRPILVDFSGSDWCGWCIKLENEVFSQPTFVNYATNNFVLFLADFPRSKPQPDEIVAQNRQLSEAYGVQGFPTVLLVDKNGKELARTGYVRGGAEAYVTHLQSLLPAPKR